MFFIATLLVHSTLKCRLMSTYIREKSQMAEAYVKMELSYPKYNGREN